MYQRKILKYYIDGKIDFVQKMSDQNRVKVNLKNSYAFAPSPQKSWISDNNSKFLFVRDNQGTQNASIVEELTQKRKKKEMIKKCKYLFCL